MLHKIDEEAKAAIRRLVAEGSTAPEIARALRTTPQVICYWTKKLGLNAKLGTAGRKRTLTQEETDLICMMNAEGKSLVEIQKALGRTISGGQRDYWSRKRMTRGQYETMLKRWKTIKAHKGD